MSKNVKAPTEAKENTKAKPKKEEESYVGAQVSRKTFKFWMARAKNTSERRAIVSLLGVADRQNELNAKKARAKEAKKAEPKVASTESNLS